MNAVIVDEDNLVELPADEEVSFLLVYLDNQGLTRHATLRSNSSGHEVRALARLHRKGFESYCKALGGTLVALQVTYERSRNLVGRPRLRLVADNTKNGSDVDLVRPGTSLYSAVPLILFGQVGDLVRLCC